MKYVYKINCAQHKGKCCLRKVSDDGGKTEYSDTPLSILV